MDTTTALQTPAGEPALIKLDIGCGSRKQPGFVGMDRIAFEGVDHVLDIGRGRWPLCDASVSEAYTSHFVEHLDATERIHFANELHRVLVLGAKCTLVVPHWATCRAYGDPTHKWPPVSEFWFYYLDKGWRAGNAPHTDAEHWVDGFTCDFEVTWGYGMNPIVAARNPEFQQFALNNYKEAIWDIHACLIKKG